MKASQDLTKLWVNHGHKNVRFKGSLQWTQDRHLKSKCFAKGNTVQNPLSDTDLKFLQRAALVSKLSEGLYQPHPYHGCILVNDKGSSIIETHQQAQGIVAAECQAVSEVKSSSRGTTAYLNIEPCHMSSVEALVEGGIERVVIGTRNPLPHVNGSIMTKLQERGLSVSLLDTTPCTSSEQYIQEVTQQCLESNEALWHRALTGKPFSLLKYAMTLDGKIAASTGHASWVSSSISRKEVFATRAKSNAVVVGGNTVRCDNPNLTTRRENGFMPTRIVMSRTLDLPDNANLWNVSLAPTIVMTQHGARIDFQQKLKDQGVQVVEFDFLNPTNVVEYCYERGFLQMFWECGGTLAAPAIASGVIHKVMAFIAPKIIGGDRAPTPCGDLGFVEMTQAVNISEMQFHQTGPDIMVTGYSPASGGLMRLSHKLQQSPCPNVFHSTVKNIEFYMTWGEWGDLSNFAMYSIRMWNGPGPHNTLPSPEDMNTSLWPSVEHYYQSQKFTGSDNPQAQDIVERIHKASTSEAATKIGRTIQCSNPELVRSDWLEARVEIMREALLAKFTTHKALKELLLSTNCFPSTIIEKSPQDYFWGCGFDRSGSNQLGKLLMSVRDDLQSESSSQEEQYFHNVEMSC